jgi:hypothetical protein
MMPLSKKTVLQSLRRKNSNIMINSKKLLVAPQQQAILLIGGQLPLSCPPFHPDQDDQEDPQLIRNVITGIVHQSGLVL